MSFQYGLAFCVGQDGWEILRLQQGEGSIANPQEITITDRFITPVIEETFALGQKPGVVDLSIESKYNLIDLIKDS